MTIRQKLVGISFPTVFWRIVMYVGNSFFPKLLEIRCIFSDGFTDENISSIFCGKVFANFWRISNFWRFRTDWLIRRKSALNYSFRRIFTILIIRNRHFFYSERWFFLSVIRGKSNKSRYITKTELHRPNLKEKTWCNTKCERKKKNRNKS